METAADFRRQATVYRTRALEAAQPATQAMLLAMAAEFDRDAKLAAREEQLERRRMESAALVEPSPTTRAA